MSFRFQIKNSQPKAEKEGDHIIRYSGVSEPFNQGTQREVSIVGVDGGGNPKLLYNTGLDVNKVEMYRWFTEEEKEEIKKQINDYLPILENAFGGKDVIAPTNRYFWGEKKEVNYLNISNSTEDIFFDTKSSLHALLYLSIVAGAFMEVVAPNKDWADRNQIPHYLVLESDAYLFEGDVEITRTDAFHALGELRKESPEALLVFAWCLLSDSNAFGGMNKATSQRDIITMFSQYIDGKLVTKKKRNCPASFLEYFEKWKSTTLRPTLYTEAYIKAGEYFAFINQREKKYTTASGTILGNTMKEAVETIMKNKFQADFENLRDAVEKKWSE